MAKLEKAGIPTVLVDLEDQEQMVLEESLASGIPNIRYLHASRTLPGEEDVDSWLEPMLDALTRPLTEKEQESGMYNPPQPRVLFEGTLMEAEKFYMQTKYVPHPVNAPQAVYTDGFPIVVPTEERVKEMLTGTSHRPDELITYQTDRPGMGREIKKKGEAIRFHPRLWTATVEKVATVAVMAGCQPEQLPAVLAIAECGCNIGSTHFNGQWVCLSGPVVKELGLNVGCGMLGPGSPVNSPIGRTYQLMAINLGGAITGVNRMNSLGSPFANGGVCIGENADGLPPGWKGLNEECGFRKDESIAWIMNGLSNIVGDRFSPGGYRAFQKSGHGGMARRLGVKGQPGPHNWLDIILPELFGIGDGRSGFTFIMIPEMARHLYEYGFKTKDEVYEYAWKKSFIPLKEYRNLSWPDLVTNGWLGREPRSGKFWKELPDDYMVPSVGSPEPNQFNIIVAGGDEEVCQCLTGRPASFAPAYSIDAWR